MFLNFLAWNGTILQHSCPSTSQKNGCAKRKHRHILETTRALLISVSCLECFFFLGRGERKQLSLLSTLLIKFRLLPLVTSLLINIFMVLNLTITFCMFLGVPVLYSFSLMNIPIQSLVLTYVAFSTMSFVVKILCLVAFISLIMSSFVSTNPSPPYHLLRHPLYHHSLLTLLLNCFLKTLQLSHLAQSLLKQIQIASILQLLSHTLPFLLNFHQLSLPLHYITLLVYVVFLLIFMTFIIMLLYKPRTYCETSNNPFWQ